VSRHDQCDDGRDDDPWPGKDSPHASSILSAWRVTPVPAAGRNCRALLPGDRLVMALSHRAVSGRPKGRRSLTGRVLPH